jgi:hypothetical protein
MKYKQLPPYKTIKIPLKNIIKDNNHICIINSAVERTHKIVIKAYQLLRLWILDNYTYDKKQPIINKNTINTIFKVIMTNTSKNNTDLYKDLDVLFKFDKENGNQLTQVLYQYSSIEILTSFENNIKTMISLIYTFNV